MGIILIKALITSPVATKFPRFTADDNVSVDRPLCHKSKRYIIKDSVGSDRAPSRSAEQSTPAENFRNRSLPRANRTCVRANQESIERGEIYLQRRNQDLFEHVDPSAT